MIGSRIQRVAIAGIVALAVLEGCETKRSSVLDPFGPPIYSFPLAAAGKDMPRGTAAITEPFSAVHAATVDTTVTVTLAGLDSLKSGVYQVWIGDAASTSPQYLPAKGTLVRTRTDTAADGSVTVTKDTTQGVSSFSAGGANTSFKLTVTPATYGSKLPTDKLVLVTIESAAGATTPGDTRPLWALRSAGTSTFKYDTTSLDTVVTADTVIQQRAGVPDTVITYDTTYKNAKTDTISRTVTASMKFGRYDPAGSYVYSAIGRGQASARGNSFVVDDSALMRPPVGYYYASYLVQYNDAGAIGQLVPLGPQTAPYPYRSTSLKDADINVISPWVTASPPEVVAAANRISADSIPVLLSSSGAFQGWSEVRVTLQTKAGYGTMAPPVVLKATLPCIVAGGC